MIDLNLINRGAAYSELKKSYVVFICLDDFAKKNRSIYTFRNCCIEDKNIELDDDSTKVFVNANGNREGLTEAQIAFLDYISGKEPSDSFTRRLNREIQKALDKEEWEVEYMTLLQRDKVKYEEGRVEGKVEGRTQELISLVRDGLLLPEIAAERLNITVDKFFELMKEKENK